MAGPLGGLELVHYLFLPGGWKPVTGEFSRSDCVTQYLLYSICLELDYYLVTDYFRGQEIQFGRLRNIRKYSTNSIQVSQSPRSFNV